ncbi:MAG: SpoIIE family protein phosphatase [Verrucomicrobiales bacterium]|nr:SpoIIE family protein phosphatase [Verrucomicrobiales bacterium]
MEPPKPTVPGKILAVDDNEINLQILVACLEGLGHQTQSAASGEAALTLLHDEDFDLVLLDVIMPGIDGFEVLSTIKNDAELRHLPVIMVSGLEEMDAVIRCITTGADDFLPKPFDPVLLRARIDACLERKFLRDQEKNYLQTIELTQQRLQSELGEAAKYVRSLLPEPMLDPFQIDWLYQPSTELGGDAFGYHWIDEEHFAIYLLDVCGHGVGASLLAASAINVIRAESLADTDFREPARVLEGLNRAFPMENQNDMYFTIWYGVYHAPTRSLHHSCGGHPPALLLPPATDPHTDSAPAIQVRCPGAAIGVFDQREFKSDRITIAADSDLLVYCDGVYEITRPDDSLVELEDFEKQATTCARQNDGLQQLFNWAKEQNPIRPFDDDYSIVKIHFP